MKKLLVCIGLALTMALSGCADEYDVMMVERHMQAEVDIARAKADATIAQSEALALTVTEDMSDLERYFARQAIASLVITPSGLKSITTGNDVVITLTQDGKAIVRDVVTGAVIYRGVIGLTDALKNSGNTTVNVEGEDNQVALTQSEVKQVVGGENNTATATQAGPGSSGSSEEELDGDCDEKVEAALEGYDLNAINLGGLMRRLSADTGCVVEIQGGQVVVDETGNPVDALNEKWGSHPELGGSEE